MGSVLSTIGSTCLSLSLYIQPLRDQPYGVMYVAILTYI